MLSSAWVIKWSELKIIDELAQGAYGKVFRGTLRGRFKVAIKLMFDSSDAPLNEDAEIRILQRARHPRLVMFFGCGKNDQHTFIVLEFMDRGSLEDLIQATHTASSSTLKSSFSWPIRLQLLHDVAIGMRFLHNLHKGCIHRDLKSANILLAVENENEELRAKVADFGLSRFIDKGAKDEQHRRFKDMLVASLSTESSNTSRGSVDQGEFPTDAGAGDEEEGFMKNLSTNSSVTMTCGAGTPVYMAPETWACMVRGSGVKHLSNKIDVYAFAVIMWEVLERQRPWSDINFTYKIKKRVMKGRRPPYSEKPHPDSRGSTEPRNFTKLLELCWDNDPHDRPTFATIRDTMDPWLEKKNVKYRRQKEEKENRAIRAEAFRLNTEATLRRLRRAKVKKEIALVVCIVNQNIDNVRVVERCCDTFAALACLAECKLKVLKGGAIDATLLAMKRFESELKVQESGALAIAFAMHNSPLNKIACFERGCVDLLLDLTETFPASSVIQRARSIIFDDFHRLQLHPTDQKLRDLGRDATALIRSATERRSLLHLFCFDLNTVERDIWRVRSITAKDVIACRRFFAQGNGRLLQNVRDFELRVNNLIAPRKCSRKQLYDMVALTKCGTSKTKRESKKRGGDVGKHNEMAGGAFDCEVFVRRMTSAAKPLAPQWARLLMLRILLRENARS
eukprot:g5215.t1